ncbi:hypothetical protein [Williamsia muralis]|uniref:Uncharacterized protein n=1 Tax=Williamsia marianensis TaxID=85044 RepID=A0A2G3PJY7_WILMA|nr:hypothetical protein [Williamsia marianensis]PHV66137.1 hypothetical protein CSW57_21195 [Williamsia marianensis]
MLSYRKADMGFTFYADGDDNGLIRVDDVSGEGEQFQPRLGQWKYLSAVARKTKFADGYEPVSEERARVVEDGMRKRFGNLR